MTADPSQMILSVEGLRAGYQSGIDILQGLSMGVEANSITLVIGPNGAGKSTLLRTIFGFLKPSAGEILFQGQPIGDPSENKISGISYVPQEINTFPFLTVEENIRIGGWTFRRDRTRLARQIGRVYEIFPVLAERRRVRANELSGGQGRMLSVAREMMTEPKLMLVDEPTVGLAPNLVGQVYELLLTARSTIGTTILLVDQNVDDAIAHSDFVYMINLGTNKAAGPAREFGAARVSALIQECLLG